MPILLLPAALGVWTWAFARDCGFREAFLKALVLCGVACLLITEALSLFHQFTRWGVAAGWALVILEAIPSCKRFTPRFRIGGLDAFYLFAISGILAIIGATAILSAPNSADAMAYHLPRVIYWIQARSVAFFPTPYLNQIMLQPFAEYAMAHTYLLSGGDRFVNLIQFTGFLGSIAGVSCIAEFLGLKTRGQAIAALVCATLPNGILQASGAKNDCVLALWLVATVYFAGRRQPVFLGLALGLAIGTKATAYLFAPPILIAVWLASGVRFASRRPRVNWSAAGVVAAGVLLLNAPQYIRNYQLSGSILGFDSAFGDGSFRWRNETLGWKPTVSNILRNLSDQLGARSDRWNQGVYDSVVRAHKVFSIDPQDPATTWRWATYIQPKNANHEADGNNRWHLLLLAIAFAAAVFRPSQRPWAIYGSGLLAAFVGFCFYLKWQPFFARLELPLFVLGAPLIASFLVSLRPHALQLVAEIAVCLFLLDGTRHPLLDNWTRPLRGPNRLQTEPRDLQYFNDMTQFGSRDFYLTAVDQAAATGCETVGIDANQKQLEYPIEALLLERNPRIRFVHVNVTNPSRRYIRPDDPQPCTVIQLR